MKKIKKFLKDKALKPFQYFGFFYNKEGVDPYNYDISTYINSDSEKLKLHKSFLESINEEEKNRLSVIESKTSTLVSQVGVIFSLLSLFIPLFIDKITGINKSLDIAFLISLIGAFLFYMLAIRNAMRNFNVKNFGYSKPSPINVINYQNESEEKFNLVLVKDLLYGANQNLKLNNIKAGNLIYSYRAFKFANTLTGLLVILICVSLFLKPTEKDTTVTLKNPIILNNSDSRDDIHNVSKKVKEKLETHKKQVK